MDDTTTVVMPWDARAIELEPVHGPYCVYAAWCEWFEAWNDRQSDNMRLDIDELDKTALFSAFQAACSETRMAETTEDSGVSATAKREAEAILSAMPPSVVVRVREGGGPEDIWASLAVSVHKLADEWLALRKECVGLRNDIELETRRADASNRTCTEQRAVIQSAFDLYNAADDERLKTGDEADAEAEKWRSEDDMYGWNFHKGRSGGMIQASIIFDRVHRYLKKFLETKV